MNNHKQKTAAVQKNKSLIAIFGGTFDPIHFGHLRAALEVFEQLQCDELRLIPCNIPPHRGTPSASAKDRLTLLTLAAANSPLIIDDRELHRDGPSYSVDTLTSLRQEYPNASLAMIVGLDAFIGLPSWHEWEKLIQLANIIVIYRSGWEVPSSGVIATLLEKNTLAKTEKLVDFSAGKIVKLKISSLEISASHIRSLLQRGESPQFLLPERVIDYIQQNRLYGYPGKSSLTQPTETAQL